MFPVLIITYILLILALGVCLYVTNARNNRSQKTMSRLIGMGMITAAIYTLSILVPPQYPRLAVLLNGVYFICTDWLAISLIRFVADYTRVPPIRRIPKAALPALAILDSVSLIVNTFTGHIFTMERVTLSWVSYWQIDYTPLQYIHLGFVYLMVAYCFGLLLYRLSTAPTIYRSKYGSIFVLLCSLVVANLACVLLKTRFDYSVLMYGMLAITICYFVLYASPKRLLDSISFKLVDNSVFGWFLYDDAKQCVSVNQTAKDLFSLNGDAFAQAEEYLALWEKEHPDNGQRVVEDDREIVRNGETVYLHVNYQKLTDENGRCIGSSLQFENHTELIRQYREEKYRATHDTLTGLFNRSAFEEEVKQILATADEPYYMICSNITDFKLINELCGTEVGDAILIAQADIIKSEQYGKSVSCRMYADKFCSLLPKTHFDFEHFNAQMTSILDGMLDVPIKAHYCFGVYEINDPNEPVWTICDKAMMATDAIRDNYGQSLYFYKEELFHRILREKEILGQFDKAIENHEFKMFLQPLIANNGKLVGAEALVRWIHPEKGMISPMDFIPVLEKAALIHKLDMYIWEQAAMKLAEWKKLGVNHLFISVNISTKDFYLINIRDVFDELSKKYDYDVKNLKLEITESALINDVKKMINTVDDLHALGYDIEIDDFGSGFSSLGLLKDVFADILKIDMIFLQKTENEARSSAILRNIISMSKDLGMPVVTEGVETLEQVNFLREAGCDFFQGFYFARPMNVSDFEQKYPVIPA